MASLLRRLGRPAGTLVSSVQQRRLNPSFIARLIPSAATASCNFLSHSGRSHSLTQYFAFHSSRPNSIRRRDIDSGADDKIEKIGPDEILFEGCDYNHWLITIDFPKDKQHTPEEMVQFYVDTAASVFGSEDEAKKKMYACSTTTYNGFQVVCDEETSEKFRGKPGVVFILPDSYIDPVNKEYGGDKYEYGVITPRPPPIQYRRQGRDRNRNYDQRRFDRQGGESFGQQGYAPRQNYGQPGQDGRAYGPPQNYGQPGQDGRSYGPPQNYGQPGQDGRGYAPPQNYGQPGQDGRGYGPPQNYGYDQPGQDGRGYGPPQNYGPPGQDRRGYGPPPPPPENYASQQNFGPPGGNYSPPAGNYTMDGHQGSQQSPMNTYQQHPNQGAATPSQGQGGSYRNVGPPSVGNFGQGSGPGFSGQYQQSTGSGNAKDMQGTVNNYGDNREGSGPDYR